jgi:predicted nuclease of predicted toxin-antitoxin system
LAIKLLIDEDSLAKSLVKKLRKAGHNVVTVNEVGLSSQLDSVVLNYAKENNRILLTHNCRDFEDLHKENPNHQGILAIYRDATPPKTWALKLLLERSPTLKMLIFL